MSRLLTVRLHLDDCGNDNGPLRVVPSSHRRGFLSDTQIQEWSKDNAITCTAHEGMQAPSHVTCNEEFEHITITMWLAPEEQQRDRLSRP